MTPAPNTPQSGPPASRRVTVGHRVLGADELFVIAGPCVLETREMAMAVARELQEIGARHGVPVVFKSSFDKANRSSIHSNRGPGLEEGLEWLHDVKTEVGMPVLTDVHLPEHCARTAEVVDILQIPAFLCRQTDLLVAAAETGCAMNVKKGQFLAPWDMKNVTTKCAEAGNTHLLVTERGTSFGYNRLVVDMSGFEDLAATGYPVVFDATHSVQLPGAGGTTTGGDRTKVPALARAALATGFVDGLFFEVHPDPDQAPSDGPNMLRLDTFDGVLEDCVAVHRAVQGLRRPSLH